MNDFKDFANVGKSIASRAIDEIGGSGGFRTRIVQTENGHATIRTHGGYPRSYPGDGSGNRKEDKPGKLRAIMYGLQTANDQKRWDGWNSATGVPSDIPMVETPFSKSHSVTWYSPGILTGDGSPVVLSWKFQGLRCGRYRTEGDDLLTSPSGVPIYSTGERSSSISLGGVSTITCSGIQSGVGVSSAALRLIDGAYWLYVISGIGIYRAKIKVFEGDGLYPRPQTVSMTHIGDMNFSPLTVHPLGFSPLFVQLPFFNQSATKACLLVENLNGYGSLYDQTGDTSLYEIDVDSLVISLVAKGEWTKTAAIGTLNIPSVSNDGSGNISGYELHAAYSSPEFSTEKLICCADYKDNVLVYVWSEIKNTSDLVIYQDEVFDGEGAEQSYSADGMAVAGGLSVKVFHSEAGLVFEESSASGGTATWSQENSVASVSMSDWPTRAIARLFPLNCDIRNDSFAFMLTTATGPVITGLLAGDDFTTDGLTDFRVQLVTPFRIPDEVSISTKVFGKILGVDFSYQFSSASVSYSHNLKSTGWPFINRSGVWFIGPVPSFLTGGSFSYNAEVSVISPLPMRKAWVMWVTNNYDSDYFIDGDYSGDAFERTDYTLAIDARCEIASSTDRNMAYMSILFRPPYYSPNIPLADSRLGQKQILAIRSESGVTLHETTGYGWFTDNAGDASGGYDYLANPVIYPPYRFR